MRITPLTVARLKLVSGAWSRLRFPPVAQVWLVVRTDDTCGLRYWTGRTGPEGRIVSTRFRGEAARYGTAGAAYDAAAGLRGLRDWRVRGYSPQELHA